MGRLGYCIPCGEGRRDVDATVMVGDDPMCGMHARMINNGNLVELPPEERTVTLVMTKPPEPVATHPEPEPVAARICSRGCGKQVHRGRCRGAQPLAALRKYRMGATEEIVKAIAPLPAIPPLRAIPPLQALAPVPGGDLDEIRYGKNNQEKDLAVKPFNRKGRAMDKLHAEEVDLGVVPKVDMIRAYTGRIGALFARWESLGNGKALKVTCRDRTHLGTTRRALEKKVEAVGLAVGFRSVGSDLYCWKESS